MSEKPDVFLPLVIGDFLKHVGRLSTEGVGAYTLILMDYWVNGAPPDDDAVLCQIARLSPHKWRKIREHLEPFFIVKNGRWVQKRAELEYEAAKARKTKAKTAADARWKGSKKDARSNARSINRASPEHMLEGCPSSSSGVVGEPKDSPTLTGRNGALSPDGGEAAKAPEIPIEVLQAVGDAKGGAFVRSYVKPCGWDGDRRQLIPPHEMCAQRLRDAAEALRGVSASIGPPRIRGVS